MAHGAELELEIAELDMENLHLTGSLSIIAESVTGHPYSEQSGKCSLQGVTVKNRGIHLCPENIFWKRSIARREQMTIRIIGNGEFHAKNVCFEGTWEIIVPSGVRITATVDELGKIELMSEPCPQPSWYWWYEIGADKNILLSRKTAASC